MGRELRMKLDEATQAVRQLEQKNQLIRQHQQQQGGMLSASLSLSSLQGPVPETIGTSGGGDELALNAGALGSLQAPPVGSGVHGRVIKGSTRPLVEVASTRSKVTGMLAQLDDNNREIELQRGEIRRLREQVHLLVSQLSKPPSSSTSNKQGMGLGLNRLDVLTPPPTSLEHGPLAPMGMPISQSVPEGL